MTWRASEELLERVRRQAAEQGRSLNDWVTVVLDAASAEDLMTPNPISIRGGASVQEALAMLTGCGFSAAPVIDEAGRPIGVLSRTDLLIHERERVGGKPLEESDMPPRRLLAFRSSAPTYKP